MKTIDLESTVRAAQKGDIDAFTHLVRTHQAMVCATTLAITASIPASEDVAQQAFVAAWNKLRELREPRRFSGWIRQIARNLGLKHQRGTERRAARVVSHPEGEGTGVEHATPESQLIAHEQDALLADALTSLPEETREVLALYYRDETSTREIADQLGLSEPTVRKRLSRARTVLHTAVDERLHRGLRATRPGAAFTAAVLAVIAASPPAHAGTQRPVTALLAACLALCILLWMLWPLSGEDRSLAVSTPPPPSQTARSVRTQRPDGTAEPPEEPTPAAPITVPYELRLQLGDLRDFYPSILLPSPLAPSTFFPMPEEAPLPDLETTTLLQALLDAEYPESWFANLEPLFEVANREGIDLDHPDLLDDPWLALTALEVTRREVRATHLAEQRHHFEAYDQMTLEERREGPPKIHYREMVTVLDQLLAQYGDEPVADYFHLYRLDAASDVDGDVYDAERRVEGALAILHDIEDPLVLKAAVQVLGNSWNTPILSRSERQGLEALMQVLPTEVDRTLTRTLTRSALATGDWEDALHHNAQQRAAVESLCPDWPAVTTPTQQIIPSALMPTLRCTWWSEDVDRLDGRLHALNEDAPTGWRAAVATAAWRCHLADPLEKTVVQRTEVTGNNWIWTGWNARSSRFTSCMDAEVASLPTPPDGLQIHIVFEV